MKTEKQIRDGIEELRKHMKNNALPEMAKVKMHESIEVLKWVLDDR